MVKRRLAGIAIGVMFLGTLSTAAVAMAASGDDDQQTSRSRAAHDKAEKADKAERDPKDHGHPPPWAHGAGRGSDPSWKDAWKVLTPAQRAAKMAELAQRHADGMKKFAACVEAAGDDSAARASCERPLPPGLAKKRLGP